MALLAAGNASGPVFKWQLCRQEALAILSSTWLHKIHSYRQNLQQDCLLQHGGVCVMQLCRMQLLALLVWSTVAESFALMSLCQPNELTSRQLVLTWLINFGISGKVMMQCSMPYRASAGIKLSFLRYIANSQLHGEHRSSRFCIHTAVYFLQISQPHFK